jgi:HK97 family phage prohead protease
MSVKKSGDQGEPRRYLKRPAEFQRAYSVLTAKDFNDGERILTGIATTPTPDRMDDIVEPLGANYELPLPFLWQHNSDQPVGWVTSAKPSKDGIPVTIKMAQIDVAGQLKDMVDFAWQSLKSGLVRGLSIGFSPGEYSYLEDSYGIRFITWNWLELSGVTIPANAEATISTIKRLDAQQRAPSSLRRTGAVKLIDLNPDVSGKSAASGTFVKLINGDD